MRTVLSAILALAIAETFSPAARAACGQYDQLNACTTQNGTYRIAMPEGLGPHPTVVYLYGSHGNASELIRSRGFVEAFTRRGYALIIPVGLEVNYTTGAGTGWYLRNVRIPKKRDETAFITEVLADAQARHGVDRNRVLIAGMSIGGFLTWEIACHAPQLASAFAPVAAGYLGRMPEKCAAPARVLHTHGRGDEVVRLDGKGDRAAYGTKIMLLEETMERMARSNGCIRPGSSRSFLEYQRKGWEGCPSAASVELMVHDGGHTIPASWFTAVLDWFEDDQTVRTFSAPPTAKFKSADGGNKRFRKMSERGGRFKRVGE